MTVQPGKFVFGAAAIFAVVVAAASVGAQAPAKSGAQATVPTFSKNVAPIFYKNCTSCHRAGEIGPMALVTYQDARPWAKSIPASGTLEYKYFEVPTNFTEDKWVKAFEVRPGDRSVVHHIIVFGRPPARPAPPASETSTAANATPAPRPQPPFTFAPGMQEPRDEAVQEAKRAPNNDRPAPRAG